MLLKLFDKLFTLVGFMLLVLLIIIGVVIAYSYYPITTAILILLIGLGVVLSLFDKP